MYIKCTVHVIQRHFTDIEWSEHGELFPMQTILLQAVRS